MLKRFRVKWVLLLGSSTLTALWIGQCVADFLEDMVIFRIVN